MSSALISHNVVGICDTVVTSQNPLNTKKCMLASVLQAKNFEVHDQPIFC